MRSKMMAEVFDGMVGQEGVKLKEAKEAGKKAVGTYCAYSPFELILAADAIPLCLCGTKEKPIGEAEQHLPRNLCPLIKSSYGFAITDTCPFFFFSDFLIAETTCDGKKKMYELMSEIKPMVILELPQKPDDADAQAHWLAEIKKTKKALEEKLGVEITEEKLRQAIKLMNEERKLLKELYAYSKLPQPPISGLDMHIVLATKGFQVDREGYLDKLKMLLADLQQRVEEGKTVCSQDAPRILLTGCPTGNGSEKVIRLVEEAGGLVVCQESCNGYRPLDLLVDEEKDSLEAIAEKYLKIPCSCMTPNKGRLELLEKLAAEYQADGIIDLTWQACHTYNIESFSVEKLVKEKLGLPFLHLESDYSENDLQQLKIRIEAFLEMI